MSILTTRLIEVISRKWQIANRLVLYLRGDKPIIPTTEINHANGIRQFLLITRCLLFILTSAFYLAWPPLSPITVKIMVVLTTLLATILAQNLYDSWDIKMLYHNMMQQTLETVPNTDTQDESVLPLLSLIALETIGGALLILPTGGLDSPFVWYALNPIIAAVVYLPGLYCWGTMGFFLCTAMGVSMVYPGFTGSVSSFIFNYMSTLLVFFLSTSMAQLAFSLHKRLEMAYTLLTVAHQTTERSLEHISSLYQALEAFSTREDKAQLVDVLAVYSSKLCDASAACFLKEGIEYESQGGSNVLGIARKDCLDDGIDWEKEMAKIGYRMKSTEEIIVQAIDKETGQLIAVPIISHGECFGLLAFLQSPGAAKIHNEKNQTLIFLAGIAGIILERLKTDELWARLLVSEEQNRIANEIHDSVSQYLFSMVCALDTISKELVYLKDDGIQEQLKLLEKTANRVSRELRASIYKLSPHKRGESIFVDNLASYLDDLGRLNYIQVDLQAEGSEEVLSPALRKGLSRIVREACSNALRHGKCSSLMVRLSMLPNQTVLEIKDDGCGFKGNDTNEPGNWQTGLGKWNMYQLAAGFNGDLRIFSEPGRGTLIRCTIPKKREIEDKIKGAVSI